MKAKVKLKVARSATSQGPRAASARPLSLTALIVAVVLALSALAPAAQTPAPLNGRDLAQKYCAGCHLFPEPDLLDKATWKNGALPLMRNRLGIGQIDPTNAQQKPV